MPIERVRPDGARIRDIVNQVTGLKTGISIEFPDGRIGATVTPPTGEVGFEQLGITMTDMEKRRYEWLRQRGHSREQALFLLHRP